MSQRPLIDTTPLRLWDGPEQPSPMPPEPARPAPKPVTPCMNCGKPSPAGRLFCNSTCKRKWSSNIGAWASRLKRTEIDGQDELF